MGELTELSVRELSTDRLYALLKSLRADWQRGWIDSRQWRDRAQVLTAELDRRGH